MFGDYQQILMSNNVLRQVGMKHLVLSGSFTASAEPRLNEGQTSSAWLFKDEAFVIAANAEIFRSDKPREKNMAM